MIVERTYFRSGIKLNSCMLEEIAIVVVFFTGTDASPAALGLFQLW